MGIFKFIAKNFSLGPAVKVWADAYNIYFEKRNRGLVDEKRAEFFFNYIQSVNLLANRHGDATGTITFDNLKSFLTDYSYNTPSYQTVLDLPTFLSVLMYFEIPLIREAFREQPQTINSILEIIFETTQKNAPNGILSKKNEFLNYSKDTISNISRQITYI